MSVRQPLHCRPEAFELFRTSVQRLDQPQRLLHAAVAVAMHEMPDARVEAVEATLQGFADKVRRRVRSEDPRAFVAHLHDVLFDEADLRGNRDDYHNPLNSYIPAVLDTRRGLPITLSLIYVNVAQRLGLRAMGLNTPLHFLAAIDQAELGDTNDPRLIVDPFDGGRTLRIEDIRQRAHQSAAAWPPHDDLDTLPIATPRQWLARLLQNLLHTFEQRGQSDPLAAMLELRMLV